MTLVEKKKYPEISWRKKSNLFNEIHTNIINNDIAEKSFIYKATEDNHLGFSDINGGMTTENRNKNYQQSVDHMNKLLKFYIILMQRKGGGGDLPAWLRNSATEVGGRSSNPIMHFGSIFCSLMRKNAICIENKNIRSLSVSLLFLQLTLLSFACHSQQIKQCVCH